MKKIEAKIVADSINPQGDRITTYLLTFPRFILAELNTHRVFSKNSASSRAIPFEKPRQRQKGAALCFIISISVSVYQIVIDLTGVNKCSRSNSDGKDRTGEKVQ